MSTTEELGSGVAEVHAFCIVCTKHICQDVPYASKADLERKLSSKPPVCRECVLDALSEIAISNAVWKDADDATH